MHSFPFPRLSKEKLHSLDKEKTLSKVFRSNSYVLS